MKRILCICLFALCVLQAHGKEKEEVKSMAEYYGIKKIHKVIAIHYKTMDQTKEPERIVLFDKEKDTKELGEILQGLSSKGDITKLWLHNIPTVQVIILYNKNKYCILKIDNSRLRRPVGGGYGLGDFKEVKKLMEILNKNPHKKPKTPDKK